MDDNMFKRLELTIIATIARNPGEYKSQYEIYNEIMEDLNIKNPEDKESLKIKFLYILRVLPGLYDDIKIVKKNEVLYIAFSPQKEDFDILNMNIEKSINANTNIGMSIDENMDEMINKNINPIENKMPLEIDVINFILDESKNDSYMLKFFNKKDYNNNTLLHNLILNNDHDRIKKSFDRLYDMTEQKNNDNKTPIELINDVKISNLFLSELIKNNKDLTYDLMLMEDKHISDASINSLLVKLLYLFFGVQIVINFILFTDFSNKVSFSNIY
jgi:hypothetical protein